MISSTIPHSMPDDEPVDDEVGNYDDFYPDFSLTDYRRVMRQDDTVTDARLRENMLLAISMINSLIAVWRHQQLGIDELTDEQQILLYKNAVYSRTKTYLLEKYIDIDTTHDGKDGHDARQLRINSERKNEREYIRALIGMNRTTITLV